MRALASALGVVFLVASVGAADADNKGKGNSSKNSGPAIKFVSAFKAPQWPGHSYNGGRHESDDRKDKRKQPSKGPKDCKEDIDARELIGRVFGQNRSMNLGWSKAKNCPRPPVSPPGHGGHGNGHGYGHSHHDHHWYKHIIGKGHSKPRR